MKKLGIVVLNYRTPDLTIDCLKSLEEDMRDQSDWCAVCVDNASNDGSVQALNDAIAARGWSGWLTLVPSVVNHGFAGGNNLGIRSVSAENYMLLNSDARLKPGAIARLLRTLDSNPHVGAIGPRLEGPDGEPQVSCFRYRTPLTEMLEAAGTGVLDRMFQRQLVPMGVFDQPMEPRWLSFACIVIRRAVIDQIGLLDDGYFMYFEDIDYSRQMRRAGWRILHDPRAVAVHLRGGSSPVKAAIQARRRVPRYYYESRSRYFAKFYGGAAGLWMTNLFWLAGRGMAALRELLQRRQSGACEQEARDNWTNFLRPLQAPKAHRGSEA